MVGTTADRSLKSVQSITMPAHLAIAIRWIVWLVDPPVASNPTMPLQIAFSSTIFAIGVDCSATEQISTAL